MSTASSTITRPGLGNVSPLPGTSAEWQTEPLSLEWLGVTASMHAFTGGGAPSEKQLSAMAQILEGTTSLRSELTAKILEIYNEEIRPIYLEAIAGKRGKRPVSPADLPELQNPGEIWRVLNSPATIFVDEAGNPTFEFGLKFDPEHSLNIRYEDGEIYDAGLDG